MAGALAGTPENAPKNKPEGCQTIIRPMAPGDYDAAYALWLSIPGMGLRSLDDSREGIAKFLARNPTTCFVAEMPVPPGAAAAPQAAPTLTGTILCGHDGRRGMIYHTCVAQALQGKGIGQRLTSAALDALKAEGINKAMLVCFAKNLPGNHFWQAAGWQKRDDLNYYDWNLNPENL